MKVLAINGSPKGSRSNTAVMIQALLDGFSTSGALTKQIYLSEKTISYCSGCYSCWTKTPGICIHRDDMAEIITEMESAECLIFGSPLFLNNISGTLKVFFDRLTAAGGNPNAAVPDSTQQNGPKYIMVSNCGYLYRSQFDIISHWINRVAVMTKAKVVAEFYTTNGKALSTPSAEQANSRAAYIEYLVGCGKEIGKNGKLGEENAKQLTRGILDF